VTSLIKRAILINDCRSNPGADQAALPIKLKHKDEVEIAATGFVCTGRKTKQVNSRRIPKITVVQKGYNGCSMLNYDFDKKDAKDKTQKEIILISCF